ncbi:hypothetical protein QUF72_21780 [Desulfobacterales bacterium HSG2]|nr:hypothetical protein [Desulfobacterales bacterium HSG2]
MKIFFTPVMEMYFGKGLGALSGSFSVADKWHEDKNRSAGFPHIQGPFTPEFLWK